MKTIFEFNNFLNVNLVIALALVGSTFTQIRFSGLPIGVSDLFFLSYIIYSIGMFSISVNNSYSFKLFDSTRRLMIPVFLFLVTYLVVSFAGTIYSSFLITTGSLVFPWNIDAVNLLIRPYHNILAYLYLVIIFTVLIVRADIDFGLIAFYTIILLSLVVVFFFIISIFTNNFFSIDLYYLWTNRLMLFTNSPNHLADFISPLPFFLLYLLNKSKSVSFSFLLIFLVIIILLTIFESQSKAAVLGVVLAFIYLLLHYIFRFKYIISFISILVIFLLATTNYLQIYYADSISNFLQNLMDSGGVIKLPRSILYDAYIRLELFFNAIEAGNMSPIIGLGLGASSGILEPFLGRESHNHISELIMTSGYFGCVSYLSLMVYVFAKITRAREPFIMAAFIVLSITTLFHMQLRQPLFWFYIVFLLYYTSNFSIKNKKILTTV